MKRILLAALLGYACSVHAEPLYRQVETLPLVGNDRWDYLSIDPVGHRLYITRATHVSVLDTETNRVIGDIPNTPGVHGVALAPALGKGFISNGKDNSISIVDLGTLQETARVKAGDNPDAILFEPATQRVFAFNGRSGTATVLDAKTNAPLATIEIGGKLEFAATDGHGTVYDNVEDKNELVAIDASTLKVTHHWPLAPCSSPSGLAMDPASGRLFAACDNRMLAVVDTKSGKVVSTPEIGAGPDAVAFDQDHSLVMTSNGESGTVSLIEEQSAGTFKPGGAISSQTGARTMALDPTTQRLYLITAKFGETPEATPDNPHPRPAIEPDSVVLLVYQRQ